MSTLEVSQIVFNLVAAAAIILVASLISIIAYDIIKLSKSVKKFMDGVNRESAELYDKVNKFLESIANLSLISKFFKKSKKGK